MDSSLYFKDKKFISATRAGEITGYTSDYVGQLCRAKKIRSKLVGKTRYVLEADILEYKKNSSKKVRSKKIKDATLSVITNRSQSKDRKNVSTKIPGNSEVLSRIQDVDKNNQDRFNYFTYSIKNKSRLPEIKKDSEPIDPYAKKVYFDKSDLLPNLQKKIDLESLRYRAISAANNRPVNTPTRFDKFVRLSAFLVTGCFLIISIFFNLSSVYSKSTDFSKALTKSSLGIGSDLIGLVETNYFNLSRKVQDAKFGLSRNFDFGNNPIDLTALSFGSVGESLSSTGSWIKDLGKKVLRPWLEDSSINIFVENNKENAEPTESKTNTVIVEKPTTKTQTVFVPGSDRSYVDQKIEELKQFFLTSPLAPNVNRYYISRQNDVIASLSGGSSGGGTSNVANLSDLSDLTFTSLTYGDLLMYNGSEWVNTATSSLGISGSGTITAVGSMTTGNAFANATADGEWLGLGSSAGRIEFNDQTTDTINILSANLGVGTTSPYAKLSVVGEIVGAYFTGTTTATSTFGGNISINGTGTSTSVGGFNITTGCYAIGGTCIGGGSSASSTLLADSNTFSGTNNFTGSVGFSSSTPFARLSINNTAGENAFVIGSSTATSFIVDSTGKVGIGTSTPATTLTIQGGSHEKIRLLGNPSSATGNAAYMSFYPNNVDRWGYFGFTSNNSDFIELANEKSGTTRRVVFDSTGRFGVGTTSPFAKLAVNTEAGDIWGFAVGSSTKSLLSVSTEGFGTTTLAGLNISGQATSTSNVGFNITTGCYAIGGTCIGGGSSASSTLLADSNTFSGTNNFTARLGLATSTPFAKLSVESQAGEAAFVVGSSTATSLIVGANGKVGIGTTSPSSNFQLGVTGNGYFSTGITLGTALTVPNGGTGASTFTTNGVLYGNTTGAILATAQGAANTILTANAGAPSFSAAPTIGTSVTTPLLIGGTAAGSTLTLKTTTGVGTANMIFQTGSNGAITNMVLTPANRAGFGTTTPLVGVLTVSSSTNPQLSLSAGAGFAQTVFRNDGTNLYISTTTVAGTATTSISALEIALGGFGTTTLRGLNISGQATSTSNVGFNITTGCYAIGGTCIGGGSSASSTLLADSNTFSGTNNFTGSVGFSSSTPFARLSINNTAGENAFVIGSSTATQFIVDKNGNVGVGTSSPTSPLHVYGNGTASVLSLSSSLVAGPVIISLTAGPGLVLNAGTSFSGSTNGSFSLINTSGTSYALPMYAFRNDADTGIGTNGNNTGIITFVNNGINSGVIDASNRFGIGTTTPFTQLQIATSSGAGFKPQFTLTDMSGGTNAKHWNLSSLGGNFYLGTSTDTYATSSISALEISGTGFGTTTLRGLNISGQATSTSNVGFNITSGCYAIGGTCISGGGGGTPGGSGTEIQYRSGASSFGAISSSAFDLTGGFLGIGTTTPKFLLNLATTTAPQLALQGSNTDNPWTLRSIGDNFYISTSSPTTFATSTFSALSILNNGSVGIATSTPSYLLDVYGSNSIARFGNSSTRSIEFRSDDSATGFWLRNDGTNSVISTKVGDLYYGYASSNATLSHHFIAGDNSEALTIEPSGNVGINKTTSIGSALDVGGTAQIRGSDSGVGLYVNSSGLVGVNTVAQAATFQVNALSQAGSYSASNWNGTGARLSALIAGTSNNGGASLSAAEPALVLVRNGVAVQAFDNVAEFKLSRYENVSTDARTRLDIALTHGSGDAAGTNVMSLLSSGNVGIGTTTPFNRLTIASTTGSQLALSVGAGINQWAFRNAGGNLYFSTTTVAGTATTSISALEIAGSGFGTTTLRGLNISGFATSTSNVGFNITTGCYAIGGTCIGGGSSASSTLLADSNTFSGTNNFTGSVGFSSSTPFARLSINNTAGENAFVIGSSTATQFIVDKNGNVGVGMANPTSRLSMGSNVVSDTSGGDSFIAINGDASFSAIQVEASGSNRFDLTINNTPTLTLTQSTGNSTLLTAAGIISRAGSGNLDLTFTPLGSGNSIFSTGNVGIGTTTPYSKLSVWGGDTGATRMFELTNSASTTLFSLLNNGTIAFGSSTATTTVTGGFDVGNGAISYDWYTGETSIQNIALGSMEFDTDGGVISWVDMPVTSSAAAGTVEKYTASIDGEPMITVYAESDGAGTTRANRVAIGTTTPYARLTVWATSTADNILDVASSASSSLFMINSSGKVGVSSSTPFGRFSVNPIAGDSIGFVVGSSTATQLSVSSLGFGTTTLSGLNISGQATSTSNVGFNITSGCYAVNGNCVGGGGLSSYDAFTHPTAGQSATTSLVLLYGQASSTMFSANQAWFGGSATSTFTSSGRLGIATTTNLNATLTLQGASGLDILRVATTTSGANVIVISEWGGITQKVSSSTALSIQMASGTPVFEVDTTASNVNAGIDITAATGQTANLLNFYSSGSTFLSGFAAGGGLFMNMSSTSAINVYNGSGNAAFVVDSTNRNVSIGTSTLAYDLTVQGDQASTYIARIDNANTGTGADGLLITLGVANASRTTGNYFIGFADGSQTVAGKIQGGASAVAYTTTAADLAEYFRATDPYSKPLPGEIVVLDKNKQKTVKKAGVGNSTGLTNEGDEPFGIISTSPGFIGNGPICFAEDINCDTEYSKYNVLVAIAGQVPVRISEENGPIKVGDYLTLSSTTPGVATKLVGSGYIVGVAVSNATTTKFTRPINPNEASTTEITTDTANTVIAYIKNGWRDVEVSNSQASTTDFIIPSRWSSLFSFLKNIGLEIGQNFVKIANLVVNKIAADRVETKQLCIDDVCIDKSQLQAIVAGSGLTIPASSNGSTGSNSSSTPSVATTTATTTPTVSTTTPSIIGTSTPSTTTYTVTSTSTDPVIGESTPAAPVVEEPLPTTEPVVEPAPVVEEPAPSIEQTPQTNPVTP